MALGGWGIASTISAAGLSFCGTSPMAKNYDLTQTLNQQKILSWLISGVIRAGHLGTPCNSFSRARDQPGGPPQLRSDLMPLGLPNLRPGDATKVKIGNILLRFSVKMLRKAKDLFIAFTLENPARSRLWICPPMRSFLRLRGVQEAVVEFCAFGNTMAQIHQVCWSARFL